MAVNKSQSRFSFSNALLFVVCARSSVPVLFFHNVFVRFYIRIDFIAVVFIAYHIFNRNLYPNALGPTTYYCFSRSLINFISYWNMKSSNVLTLKILITWYQFKRQPVSSFVYCSVIPGIEQAYISLYRKCAAEHFVFVSSFDRWGDWKEGTSLNGNYLWNSFAGAFPLFRTIVFGPT